MERWTKASSIALAAVSGLIATGVALGVTTFMALAVYLDGADSGEMPVLLGGLMMPLTVLSLIGVGLGVAGLVYRFTRRTAGDGLVIFGAASLGWIVGLLAAAALWPYFGVVSAFAASSLLGIAASRLLSRIKERSFDSGGGNSQGQAGAS